MRSRDARATYGSRPRISRSHAHVVLRFSFRFSLWIFEQKRDCLPSSTDTSPFVFIAMIMMIFPLAPAGAQAIDQSSSPSASVLGKPSKNVPSVALLPHIRLHTPSPGDRREGSSIALAG